MLGILVAACGGGSNSADQAKVRIAHVSPGTDSITATFNGYTAASQLKYHEATTYQGVTAGTTELVVKSAASGSTMIDTNVTLTAKARYTFVIYGGCTSAKVASVADDTDTSASGKFNLRLSHSATGIGTLDLYLLSSGTSINDTSPAYSGLAYANNTGFIQFTNGDYDIVLAPSGSRDRNLKIEPLSTPGAYVYDQSQTLGAGYDMSFVGVPGASGAASLVGFQDNNLPSASSRARVRVVNASADGTAYDVYVNYSKLLSGVSSVSASAYQELDPAAYVIGFAPAGSTSQTLTLASQSLDASHVYTVYIYGQKEAVAAVLVKDL